MKTYMKKLLCLLTMAVCMPFMNFIWPDAGYVKVAATDLPAYGDTFDNEPTGPKQNINGWTVVPSAYGTVTIEEFPGAQDKSMKLADPDYDTAAEYRTSAYAYKTFAPISGKVVFETRMLFKKINHPNNNFEIGVFGDNNTRQAARFLGYSSGAFGYYDGGAAPMAKYIPGVSGTFIFPENEWITLKITLDTGTSTFDLSVTCNSLKTYNGTVDPAGILDTATGTYTVTGKPFYNGNTVTGVNAIRISLNRYTGEYYFDDLRVYRKDTVNPTAPANLVETGKTDTTVSMAWDASTDDVGVAGYDIYKDYQYLDSVTDSVYYTAQGLQPGMQYTFTVMAKDAQGNLSPASNELTTRTVVDMEIVEQLLASAIRLRDSAQEGVNDGNFLPDTLSVAVAALQAAMDETQAVVDNTEATQEQVISAVSTLNMAIQAFESKRVTGALWDMNHDGRVSLGDIAIAAGYCGKNSSSPDWETVKKADINADGNIDAEDLTFMSQRMTME